MPPQPLTLYRNGLDARTSGEVSLAFISPCSTCKNRRDKQDKDGKPACPRMVHIKRQQEAQARGEDTAQLAHLTLTGLEYNPFNSPRPGVLANPVYDVGRGSVYLWIARLVDNNGMLDAASQVVVPPITSPDFFERYTDHIVCMQYPVIPADTLAQYFAKGRMQEGETVLAVTFHGQHLLANGSEAMVDGVASRVALHGGMPLSSRPKKDDHPRGT